MSYMIFPGTLTWSWFVYGGNTKKKGQGSPFPYLGYWVNGLRNDFQKYLGIKKKKKEYLGIIFGVRAGVKFFWYKLTQYIEPRLLKRLFRILFIFFSNPMKTFLNSIPVFSFFPFYLLQWEKEWVRWLMSLEEGSRYGLLWALCALSGKCLSSGHMLRPALSHTGRGSLR